MCPREIVFDLLYRPYCNIKKTVPCRSSSSSSTLKAVNLFGSTPWSPSTWILALLNPHWGSSGVPFMKRTTGALATALSIAVRVASESHRSCNWVGVRRNTFCCLKRTEDGGAVKGRGRVVKARVFESFNYFPLSINFFLFYFVLFFFFQLDSGEIESKQ